MTLAAVILVVAMAALLVTLLVLLAPVRDQPQGVVRSRAGRVLRLLAVIVTVGVGIAVATPAWRDSGTFALVLVGVPVAAAAAVLGLDLAGRPTTSVTWTAVAAMLAWSLLTGLGLGLHFLGPSVLMVLAAVVTTRDRRREHAGARSRAD